jgi:hypothetical protein
MLGGVVLARGRAPVSVHGRRLQHAKNEEGWDTDLCTDTLAYNFIIIRSVLSPVGNLKCLIWGSCLELAKGHLQPVCRERLLTPPEQRTN